jgi:hypothetical protein
VAESATLAGHLKAVLTVPSPWAPLHCGVPMQWRSPEPVAMSSYSFGPADPPLALPAVWRCGCGFQLDDGFQLSVLEQVHTGASPSVSR